MSKHTHTYTRMHASTHTNARIRMHTHTHTGLSSMCYASARTQDGLPNLHLPLIAAATAGACPWLPRVPVYAPQNTFTEPGKGSRGVPRMRNRACTHTHTLTPPIGEQQSYGRKNGQSRRGGELQGVADKRQAPQFLQLNPCLFIRKIKDTHAQQHRPYRTSQHPHSQGETRRE
jgi:hypothetical protein